jgi:hypothetical protein
VKSTSSADGKITIELQGEGNPTIRCKPENLVLEDPDEDDEPPDLISSSGDESDKEKPVPKKPGPPLLVRSHQHSQHVHHQLQLEPTVTLSRKFLLLHVKPRNRPPSQTMIRMDLQNWFLVLGTKTNLLQFLAKLYLQKLPVHRNQLVHRNQRVHRKLHSLHLSLQLKVGRPFLLHRLLRQRLIGNNKSSS